MLGLGLGLGLAVPGLGLVPCGFVNITAFQYNTVQSNTFLPAVASEAPQCFIWYVFHRVIR